MADLKPYTDCLLETWGFDQSVLEEHRRQIAKWGVQTHTMPEWLMFLGEEVGELNEAVAEMIYRGGADEDARKEAIQVATLALKIAEMLDPKRKD